MTIATHHRRRPATAGKSDGFTLVEILIAVSIIVLMIGLALPAFRAITGSRSVEGATNNVSAMLARARTDAVGLQVARGVAFFTDATGQCRMAEVGPVQFPAWAGTTTSYPVSAYVSYVPTGGTVTSYYVSILAVPVSTTAASPNKTPDMDATHWRKFVDGVAAPVVKDATFAATGQFYDQLPDTDTVPLPLGIAAQTIADGGSPAPGVARTADGYLHVGVIAFDQTGRLAQQATVFSQYGVIGTAARIGGPTKLAFNIAKNTSAACTPLASQFGLVLYDRDAHDALYGMAGDPTYDSTLTYTSGTPSPADEETWVDANATPLLINRYTGTLVRGE